MKNLLLRLVAGVLMEIALAVLGAPFYMQIFPVALFVWVAADIASSVKIVRIETRLNLPKNLQKDIEKIAKKQAREIEKSLRAKPKDETKEK
jgi:hypothetical protein